MTVCEAKKKNERKRPQKTEVTSTVKCIFFYIYKFLSLKFVKTDSF